MRRQRLVHRLARQRRHDGVERLVEAYSAGLISHDESRQAFGAPSGFIMHDFDASPPFPRVLPLHCGICGVRATAYVSEAGTPVAQPCGHPVP